MSDEFAFCIFGQRIQVNQLLGYFKDAFYAQGGWKTHLTILGWCGVLLFLNYGLELEPEIFRYLRNNGSSRWMYFGYYFSVQFIPFAVALLALLGLLGVNEVPRFKTLMFWGVLGAVIIGFDRSFVGHFYWFDGIDALTRRYLYRVIDEAKSFVTLLVPLIMVFAFLPKQKEDGFFGVRFRSVHLKWYWILLAGMVPLIFAASLTEGFQSDYPRYNPNYALAASSYFGVPNWFCIAVYEVFYLADFFTVELFFRGFLIIGLSRIAGPYVIMPMAASYCALHFGKPFGEALSSIFGGYILGVLAFYTRNIWGGVFIHMGIAGLMELFAFLQMAVD